MVAGLTLLCLALVGIGWADEVATMPLPDLRAENEIWGRYYHIWLKGPGALEDEMGMVHVGVGLTDYLEAGLVWGSDGGFSFTTLNLTARVASRDEWEGYLGAVNLFSDDYFRSEEASPYLMAARRLNWRAKKEGQTPPQAKAFLGWGAKSHGGWFGGVLADLTPQTRVTVGSYPAPYGGHKAVLALSHSLPADSPRWALGVGVWGGSPWLSVGTPGGWIPWPR